MPWPFVSLREGRHQIHSRGGGKPGSTEPLGRTRGNTGYCKILSSSRYWSPGNDERNGQMSVWASKVTSDSFTCVTISLTRGSGQIPSRWPQNRLRVRCTDRAGRPSRSRNCRIVTIGEMNGIFPPPLYLANDSIFTVLMYGSMDDLCESADDVL